MSRFLALTLTMQKVVTVLGRADLDPVGRGDAAGGAGAARRDVDLAAGRAAFADGAAVGEGVDVGGLGAARGVHVVETGLGDDPADRVVEPPVVRGGSGVRRRPLVRLEAGDVGDGAGPFGGPADADAHAGGHGVGAGCVEGVQEAGVRAVELDQDPGEGGVEGLAAAGSGVPGPGGDGAGGLDLDEVAELVGGDGVVLDGWDQDLAVGGLHAEDGAFAQAGQERALDGAERAGEGELDDERGFEDFGHFMTPWRSEGFTRAGRRRGASRRRPWGLPSRPRWRRSASRAPVRT